MKMRIAAAATALGSAVVLAAIAAPSAQADSPSPSPSNTWVSGPPATPPAPSPSGSQSSSPLPSPTGGGSSSPVPSPSGGTHSPVPSPSGTTTSAAPSPSTPAPTALPSTPANELAQLTIAGEGNDRTIPGGPVLPGGPALELTVTVRNPGPHDMVTRPFVVIGSIDNKLYRAKQKVEVQDAKGAWHAAVAANNTSDYGYFLLAQPGPDGKPVDDAWFYLAAGEKIDLRLRVAVTADATDGIGFLNAEAPTVALSEEGDPISSSLADTFGFFRIGAEPTPSAYVSHSPTSSAPTDSPSAPATSAAPLAPPVAPAVAAAPVAAPAKSVIVAAKAADKAGTAGAAAKTASPTGPALASTGGGGNSLPIGLGGAAVLAAGVGTLVVLRRRKGSHA